MRLIAFILSLVIFGLVLKIWRDLGLVFSHTKEGPIFSFVHNFPIAYGGLRRTIGAILKDIIEDHWT
jgi:hypothetical protein